MTRIAVSDAPPDELFVESSSDRHGLKVTLDQQTGCVEVQMLALVL
jgi:hypothetical protein